MKLYARLAVIIPVLALLLAPPVLTQGGAAAVASETPAIRPAPPAPVFTDEERQAELRARRGRVAAEVGAKGVAVFFSAEPRLYTNDVDYEFRQENNLFYLTHLNQQGATLVLLPGNTGAREILFLPRRNPAREAWDGYMYSAEDARRISGVEEVWDAREFEPFAGAVRARQPYRPAAENVLLSPKAIVPADLFGPLYAAAAAGEATLHLLVPERDAASGRFGESPEWRQEQRFAGEWAQGQSGYKVRSLMPLFRAMRLRKSPSEIRLMQHAVDITAEALGRAMAAAGSAGWEYEVEAEVDYTFRRRNADNWGYPSIVGCGPNATTLHYNASQGRVRPGDLILMDVGAEYTHYTADITRTFPVSGKFTKEQADIYNLVLAAQEAGMRAVRPGAQFTDVNAASVEVVKDGLLRLGLITGRDATLEIDGRPVPQYRLWLFHGTTHWLGMNVHDVGGGNERLEPGMVFTNEPGVYVRADALDYLPKTSEVSKFVAAVRPAFERYKNIGVRIEDDVLVTPEGSRNLSAAIPRTLEEVESFIARARRELSAKKN
ncbi:MAG TPA: aminopeptidase P family protein [Pyrinomonadaceae bacterium]|nr:aminopeptidase P family protein [Pyrinomonadaceae bacterium]